MNVNNTEQLKSAAEAGNINLLYSVIQDDSYILERIDSIPFVDTPLHIAASMGHLQFAIEIMRLKPSFALKLNPEGLSPIHLAIQNKRMMLCLVGMNKDLVRVRGKRGWTPLHLASQIGDVDILDKLLHACPDSLEDVTGRPERERGDGPMEKKWQRGVEHRAVLKGQAIIIAGPAMHQRGVGEKL
jgi:ankyrin repeat protein